MVQKSMEVQLDNGLEARPVAVFVQVASQYESTIYVEVDDKKVNTPTSQANVCPAATISAAFFI